MGRIAACGLKCWWIEGLPKWLLNDLGDTIEVPFGWDFNGEECCQ